MPGFAYNGVGDIAPTTGGNSVEENSFVIEEVFYSENEALRLENLHRLMEQYLRARLEREEWP